MGQQSVASMALLEKYAVASFSTARQAEETLMPDKGRTAEHTRDHLQQNGQKRPRTA